MDRRVVASLGLSFTGAALVGCQPEDPGPIVQCGAVTSGSVPGPPVLVSAQMDELRLIRLTFSEPLADVGDVDPKAFRLSFAWSSGSYDGSDYTAYYDPMALLCSGSDFCPGEYTDVIELGCAPDDPKSLMLRLDTFHRALCNWVGYSEEYGDPSPLTIHFDASIGMVTDLDGEPLASISPEFVTAPYYYLEVDGEFPNYPMRIPIPCPD